MKKLLLVCFTTTLTWFAIAAAGLFMWGRVARAASAILLLPHHR
jgi:hypothetical protein